MKNEKLIKTKILIKKTKNENENENNLQVDLGISSKNDRLDLISYNQQLLHELPHSQCNLR